MKRTKDARYLIGRFAVTGALLTLLILIGEVINPKNIVIVNGDNNVVTVAGRDVKTEAQEILDVFGGGKDAYNAVAVAKCESCGGGDCQINPKAQSKTSSARGAFQIIAGTWYAYKCVGDPYNIHDNAVCAKKIFDNNGSWGTSSGWKASQACWKGMLVK